MQQNSSTELAFIDSGVPNAQALAASIPVGTEVVWLNAGSDPWQQITQALSSHTDVSAIHLISHGSSGEITLGGINYNAADLAGRSELLNSWSNYLTDGADFLLYGCNIGSGEAGTDFLNQLSQLTGTDVAASTDMTGSANLGGDWDLETATGTIETSPLPLAQADWQGTLPTSTVYDASYQQLVFNNYTPVPGTGTAGQDGSIVHYSNVITVNGQAIDAVMTVALTGATIPGFEPSPVVSANNFELNPLDVNTVGGYGMFTVAFYKAGTYTGIGTGTAVTLQNVAINSYDIDADQFQEFRGFASYEVASSNSILTPTVQSDGSVRFQSTSYNNPNQNGNITNDVARVKVYYDSISTFQLKAGLGNGQTGGALFSLDFSQGPAWAGLVATTTTPAPRIAYSTTIFQENPTANDGSVSTTATVTLTNASSYTLSGSNGDDLIANGHVTISNVPAGLSAVLTRTSDTTAILSYTGNATSHADSADVNNVTINFLDAAFTGGLIASNVSGTNRADLTIDFDPIFTVSDPASLLSSNIIVNEASPYTIFKITNNSSSSQTASLNLSNITAIGSGTDYGSATTNNNLEYSTDNGANWTSYSALPSPTITSHGTLLVRTPITNDTVYEGAETFTLTATPVGGYGAMGTATIMDNGTGTIYNADGTTNSSTALNNDTPAVTVSSVTVSEASPYAVVAVSLSSPSSSAVTFTPGLVSGTGTVGTDTGSALEYYNGSYWVSTASGVSIAAGATSVLLRTTIVNDNLSEISEGFQIGTGALTTNGVTIPAASGTVTIKDDGSSSNVFLGTNNTATPTTGIADNDVSITVSVGSVTVSEASPYAVVTVSLSSPSSSVVTFTPGLVSGTGTSGTDTGSSLEYYNGSAWVSAASGVIIPAGSTEVLLRTSVSNDDIYEGKEALQISTGPITGNGISPDAVGGTVTIADDGSSSNVFLAGTNSATPLLGTANNDGPQTVLSDTNATLADGIDNLILNNISKSVVPGTATCLPDWMAKLAGNANHPVKTVANLNGTGNSLGNELTGNNGHNKLSGLDGNDTLYGLKGNDVLIGGAGSDTLYGGAGKDTFKYLLSTDSQTDNGQHDIIADFQRSLDKIDLRSIDANSNHSGNQAFKMVSAFSQHAGQVYFDTSTHLLQGDVNGDGSADFAIEITGVAKLAASDILL